MNKPKRFVGIAVDRDELTVTVLNTPGNIYDGPRFTNTLQGIETLCGWVSEHCRDVGGTLICVERRMPFSRGICLALDHIGYLVTTETARDIAFHQLRQVSKIDSKQIAQFAYRFFRGLNRWQPDMEAAEFDFGALPEGVRELDAKLRGLSSLSTIAARNRSMMRASGTSIGVRSSGAGVVRPS